VRVSTCACEHGACGDVGVVVWACGRAGVGMCVCWCGHVRVLVCACACDVWACVMVWYLQYVLVRALAKDLLHQLQLSGEPVEAELLTGRPHQVHLEIERGDGA
jgi:hypothetical protein